MNLGFSRLALCAVGAIAAAIYALVRAESNVELWKIFKDTFGALQGVLGRDVEEHQPLRAA